VHDADELIGVVSPDLRIHSTARRYRPHRSTVPTSTFKPLYGSTLSPVATLYGYPARHLAHARRVVQCESLKATCSSTGQPATPHVVPAQHHRVHVGKAYEEGGMSSTLEMITADRTPPSRTSRC
jgi:hypothetical protein